MKESILQLLNKELEIAQLKEDIAKREYQGTNINDIGKYSVNYAHYTKAQGYQNGIIEAIYLITRIKED